MLGRGTIEPMDRPVRLLSVGALTLDTILRVETLPAHQGKFIADDGGRWVGTVTVLLREPGASDHLDRAVTASRADLVGVYVAPSHRGTGLLGRLVDAAHDWARDRGAEALTLDVHVDNARAQAAYRRLGFVPTGETFSSAIGAEIVMRRPRP